MDSQSELPRTLSLAVHEFRTPITVVSGYLRMLLRELAGPLSDKQRHMLQEMDQSCGRLNTYVEQMSLIGKLDSGDAAIVRKDMDLAGLVAEVASGMHEGNDRGVELELRGLDHPLVVTGDRPRLTTALHALIHSALREHGDRGTVVAQCSTYGSDDRKYAVVAIAPDALLPVLLQNPLADAFAFDEYRGGTGMALPVARRIIERHGGMVWSAATAQELAALYAGHRSGDHRVILPDTERSEIVRRRAASALRLPLRD